MSRSSALPLPLLLDALQSMRGHDFYELVSTRELNRANAYYRREAVQEFAWSEDGEQLFARVEGRRDYTVSLTLEDDGIYLRCDCPAFGEYSATCKHTVATLFTICNVLEPNRFRPSPFSERSREILHQQLLANPASQDPDQEPPPLRMILCKGWAGNYVVDVLHANRFRPTRLPGWADALFDSHAKRRLDGLLRAASMRHEDAELLIDVDDEECEIGGVLDEPVAWTANLDVQGDGIVIQAGISVGGEPADEGLVICDKNLVFLPARKLLARVKNVPLIQAYKALRYEALDVDPHFYMDPRGPFSVEEPIKIPRGDHSGLWDEMVTALASKRGSRLLIDGRPATATPQVAELLILINGDPGKNVHSLHIASEVKGSDLDWHAELDAAEFKKVSESRSPALTGAKTRRKALRQAEDEIYCASGSGPSKAIAEATSTLDIFRRVRCERDARTYLNQIARTVHSKKKRIQVCTTQNSVEWVQVERHLQPLAAVKALARQAFSVAPEDCEDGFITIPNQRLSSGLAAFATLCKEQGIPLLYNRAPLQTKRLHIAVEVERSRDVDWFELHPEVTADGFRVDQAKWERLIRGELVVDEGGSAFVIDPDSSALLQRLQALVKRKKSPPPSGADTNTQVPRLRIFEWLELERAGITLNLPAADRDVLNSLRNFTRIPVVDTPDGLQTLLRPYQQEGLNWLAFLYRHRFGACLADDMGLGKTIQAIALLAAIQEKRIPGTQGDARPHLLIVPPSLLYNWQHEIERFCPTLNVVEYTGQKRTLAIGPGDILLTTYELARRDIQKLKKQPFDVVIFDEAQQVKNSSSRRNQAIQHLQSRFRLCLTGTPLENHVGEYFTIMELALPGLLEDARPFPKSVDGPKEEEYVRRTHPFLLRRTKAEILKDLPPKQDADVYLDMSPYQKELYTRTVGEVREQVLQAYADRTPAQAGIIALSALTRLRQICVAPALLDPDTAEPAPKLQHLQSALLELGEEGHSALVFSQFTRALDLIEPTLRAVDIPFTRLDGQTPTAKRKERIALFQQPDGPRVFLISLRAGGVGLNLTRASYVFHVDPWWNPAVEMQATDRAHRIGQKRTVMVNRILMHHTIEEKLMTLKAKKAAVFQQILDSKSARGKGTSLSREDLDFLLG